MMGFCAYGISIRNYLPCRHLLRTEDMPQQSRQSSSSLQPKSFHPAATAQFVSGTTQKLTTHMTRIFLLCLSSTVTNLVSTLLLSTPHHHAFCLVQPITPFAFGRLRNLMLQ